MSQSARTTAPVTLVVEVDCQALVEWRERLREEGEGETAIAPSFTDVAVKVVAKALEEHPLLNSTLTLGGIRIQEEINIGMAVALEDGLIVPVIRRANRKTVEEIARESKRLVEAARQGKLSPDDVGGGTFTISNLGAHGVDFFSPIINPPEAAILGMGRIAERPVAGEGEVVVRPVMYLSLVFDHRLVDGAPAAVFLGRVKELFERPHLVLGEA